MTALAQPEPAIGSPAFQPVGSDIWVALGWCVAILVLASAFAMVAYRRRVRR